MIAVRRTFRPQVRSRTIGALYGTRHNGRSGDLIKILRRNYANKCSVRASCRANAMPALGHEQSFATQSHVSSTLKSRHLAIHSSADEKIMIAHESRERVAKLFH